MNKEFEAFPSISRLSRNCVVTEKLDGTNAQIFIPEPHEADNYARKVMAGSRNRWIEPGDDNFGFAAWVEKNHEELLKLGPGTHYGEWWGAGIQRRYGLTEKRFTLFNTARWNVGNLPSIVSVVPVLYNGMFDTAKIDECLEKLRVEGSVAAPGFMGPEGIVIFHEHSRTLFKKTLDKNDAHKGALG